jgi:hypothetical protein
MAAKRKTVSATVASLKALGTDRLAELLAAAARADRSLMRTLSLELATQAGSLDLEIDKQIARLATAKGRLDAPRAKTLASELQGLLATVVSGLGDGDPAAGLSRLIDLIALARPLMTRCSYDAEVLVQVFQSAYAAAAPLFARLAPGSAQDDFAGRLLRLCLESPFQQSWMVIGDIAASLGVEGRARLRRLIEDDLKPFGAQPERFSAAWGPFIKLIQSLCALADADGDVDAYAAAQRRLGPRLVNEVQIASRLIAHGRAVEALRLLQGAKPNAQQSAQDLESARIDALEADGQADKAQAARWAVFRADLSIDMLKDYLARLPDFEDAEYEEAALDWVQVHPKALDALDFLVAWPDRRRAGALVRARLKSLDGEAYDVLGPAAGVLAAKDPLAATLLHRVMISDALQFRRSGRYGHAARHLAECSGLAASITDWETWPNHDAYLASLRANHARQYAFWERVDTE